MSIRKRICCRRTDILALKKTRTMKTLKLLTSALIIIAISLLPMIALPTALAAPGDSASDPIIYDPNNTDDFPLYPDPGGVSLGKNARWVDGSDYMKAEVDLIVSGQPKPQGVDVVLVLDVSGSMGDPSTNGSYYYIPNPNVVSRQVTLTKNVTYGVSAPADGITPPDVNTDSAWTTQTDQTVTVTFTAYVDTTTDQIVAASDFSGSIPGLVNNTDNYYLRYSDTTSGTGYNPGAGADRYTSVGAKDFYLAVFVGEVIAVEGINVTLPSNFSTLPTSAEIETTRIEQMQIAANEFLDIMFEANSYVDAYGVTHTTASLHRVSMLTFSYTDVLYQNGAFFGESNKSAMQSWISSRTPGGTTNYVDALNAAQKIVESRNAEDSGLYADRPIFVVFMSDGVPQIPANSNNGAKYIGTGRDVAYANPGTGDAYAINNARSGLHAALTNANSGRNGVYTIGYIMSSDDGISWLTSIAKQSGTYNAVTNVEAIRDVFRRIAGETKEAGTNAVITDYMGSPYNPESTYFNVDITYPVKIKIGNSAQVVLTMTQSGADEYTYANPSLPGQSVTVDKSVVPNSVIWELGSILQDEAVLTFGIELPEASAELNGLYYTNESANIVYENYLGHFVTRPLSKSPQLLKPGNSIRVVYFATNDSGYAVAANGNQLGTAGQTVGQVNTVGNIFGTNAIIINDYYFEYDGRITLNPLPTPYHVVVDAPTYVKDGLTFEKVDVSGAFRTYDVDADTYSNNIGDSCDITMLESTYNGFIVLVGYTPRPTATVTFKNADPAKGTLTGTTVFSGIKGADTPAIAEPGKTPAPGYEFDGWDKMIPTIYPDEDMTITGSWKALTYWEEIVYTITYNNLEGATNDNPATFTQFDLPITLAAPGTRASYEFIGWYTDRELTTAVTVIDTIGDKIVYAKWEATGGGSTVIVNPPPPLAEIKDEGPPLADLDIVNHFAYIVGYGDGTVRPQNNITRAEAATIFFRLLTAESREEIWSKTNDFPDVATNSWYNNAVSTLAKGGVLLGYPDGTFRPNAEITRAEFAAIAVRFRYNGDLKTFPAGLQTFTDIGGHWAENYIKLACELGYVNGYSDGSFKPDAPITRAEVMTLLNNVLNRHVEADEDMIEGMKTWPDNPKGAWFYFAIQEATNSHYFERKPVKAGEAEDNKITENVEYGIYEIWTELRVNPDWSALEHPTSTPYDVRY